MTERTETVIEGLPEDLPAGHYEMAFSDFTQHPDDGHLVMRFRYVGPAQQQATAAVQATAEGWLPDDGCGHENWLPPGTRPGDVVSVHAEGEIPSSHVTVSYVESVNLTRLARVIAELMRQQIISAASIGMPLKPGSPEGWGEQVEAWLRS